MQDTNKNQDLIHLRPSSDDEIDLGELIRKLVQEWQTILLITVFGALMGVAVALSLPKQYRVEVEFSPPTMSQIAPLLSQSLIRLDRQQIVGEFLKKLQSRKLLEQALLETNNFLDGNSAPLNDQERVSKITAVAKALQIIPKAFAFLPDDSPINAEYDQISISTLSTNPSGTKEWLSALLVLAEDQTISDLVADIDGQKSIAIQKFNQQLQTVSNTAVATQQTDIERLSNSLKIAQSLNIIEPIGDSNNNGYNDYNKGSAIIAAELEALKNNKPVLQDLIIGYEQDNKGNTIPTVLSPQVLQGQLKTLQQMRLDMSAATLLGDDIQVEMPALAEKPNQALIAGGATLVAAFLGLFFALIRVSIRKDR